MKSYLRLSRHRFTLRLGILSVGVYCGASLPAENPVVGPGNWTVGGISVEQEGNAASVNATFTGLPWVNYAVSSSPDGMTWTPVAAAEEGLAAGQYMFHHSTAAGRQLYRAQLGLPGPIKTFDAHYCAGVAGLVAADHRYGLAYNEESILAIKGGLLDLGRGIEQGNQALMGVVNVVALQNGMFQVSWAGNQQVVNGAAARDMAVQNFQQQRNATQQQVQQAQLGTTDMNNILGKTLAVEPLADAEAHVADCEAEAITGQLLLPTGPAYLCFDSALAGFALDTVSLDKRALQKEKVATEQRITKLRQEATRKRQMAAQPVQVFGINGTWFVRWANVELTYPSQAAAQSTGVAAINQLKAARIAEADALDAEANGLEAALPAMTTKIDAACTSEAAHDADYQAKLAACPDTLTDPKDTDHPRARFGAWIGFPPDYLDDMWEEMYREWLAAKTALRNKLIAMGASEETIAEEMRRMDDQMNVKRKWMSVFCDEPIKLTLMIVNQFTGCTVDPATAKWEIEYDNLTTHQIERVPVGMGSELCLTPEQVKAIFAHAKDVQHQPGDSVLINIAARFEMTYPDGRHSKHKVIQQVIVTNWTRAKYNDIFHNLPR